MLESLASIIRFSFSLSLIFLFKYFSIIKLAIGAAHVPPKPEFSTKTAMNDQLKSANISNISNIKNVITHIGSLTNPHECICNAIIENIKNPDKIEFLTFRDILYDILIYELDINECIWYILTALMRGNLVSESSMSDILLKTNIFFQYYNNNYRPIYHLENYMYNLITIVNGYKKSAEGS